MRRALLPALVLAGLLGPAAAHAEDYYVTADAVSLADTCPATNPCSFEGGVDAAQTGDVVHVASGVYDVPSNFISVRSGVTVVGEGASRPIIKIKGALTANASGVKVPTRLRHLEVDSRLELEDNAEGIDLVARSAASTTFGAVGVRLIGGRLHQSLVVATGEGAVAVLAEFSDSQLTSSTVVATGPDTRAVIATTYAENGGCRHPGDSNYRLDVRNVIARGAASDLLASSSEAEGCATPVAVNVSHSNFRSAVVPTPNATITQGDGNQTTSALTDDTAIFADTTLFRQRNGAPTRNAGTTGVLPIFPTDADGQARVQEGGVDIGADELPAPPLVAAQEATEVGRNGATLKALVTPNAAATHVVFDHGPTAAYGSTTPAQVLPAGAAATTVQARIEGLAPGSTFHYRVRAFNPQDSVQGHSATGADATFVTLPAPVIAPPLIPLPDVLAALTVKKSIKLATFSKKGLKVGFALGRPGTPYSVKLTARLRVKGRLRTVTLGRARGTAGPGVRTVTVKPSRRTVARLRKLRRVKAKLVVNARPAGGAADTASRSVTIRR